ncbi:MAG: TolC family protein [Bacteroidales bacterium]
MMKSILYIALSVLLLQSIKSGAQEKILLTLDGAIEMAHSKSISSFQSRTKKEDKYWQWRAYQANYLPQLALSGVIPEYKKTYEQVLQPDGSVQFQKLQYNSALMNLSLSQYISLTGSTVYASSSVLRYNDLVNKQIQYNNNPFVVGLNQPILKFNPLKWDKLIEPLKYEESKREYVQEMEQIALETSNLFFDVLLAQKNQEIAKENLENNDTLYAIALEKNKLGKVSKNDLLQLRLAIINAKKLLIQANLEFTTAILNFKTYLGITDEAELLLEIPENTLIFNIDPEIALAEAWKNRSEATSFKLKLLEADRQIAEAKRELGMNADLSFELGYSNSATNLSDSYINSIDRQIVHLKFYIPIADWGKARSQRKVAYANKKLTEYTVKQEEVNFEKTIRTQIEQFKILSAHVEMTSEAQKIAEERYKISIERYKLGDINITELNIATSENNEAKQDYINTLKKYWDAFYQIRLLTMYDFINQHTISYE